MNLAKVFNTIVNTSLYVIIAFGVYCVCWSLDKPMEFSGFVHDVAAGFANDSFSVLLHNLKFLFIGWAIVTALTTVYHKFTAK